MRNRKAINLIARNGKAMWDYAVHVRGIDAAARAVILAEYGKQVWSDVKQYAKAHPQIVEFINQDPHLAASISPNSNKERWLVGDGKAYILTEFYATQNTTAKAKAKLLGKSVSAYQAIFGARQAVGNRSFDICLLYPDKIFFDFSNTSVDNVALGALGTEAVVELSKDGGWLNGTKVFDSSKTAFTTPSKVLLFSRTDGTTVNARPLNGAIAYAEFGGDIQAHFLPCLYNGIAGMVDVISGTFHPNANTQGAFTIAITDKE